MNRLILVLAFIICQSANLMAYDQLRSSITFGPTFHYQFGEKPNYSLGFEVSYWAEPFTWPKDNGENESRLPWSYGIDFGFEIDKYAFRLYTEPEIGPIFFGMGVGPVLNIERENFEASVGFQGTIWAAAFGGLDLRLSAHDGRTTLSAGSFAKLPIPLYHLDYM